MRDYEGDGRGEGRIWHLYKVTWGGETGEGGTSSKGGGVRKNWTLTPGAVNLRAAAVQKWRPLLAILELLNQDWAWEIFFAPNYLADVCTSGSAHLWWVEGQNRHFVPSCPVRTASKLFNARRGYKGVTRSPGPSPVRSKVKVETIWKPVASGSLRPQTLNIRLIPPPPPAMEESRVVDPLTKFLGPPPNADQFFLILSRRCILGLPSGGGKGGGWAGRTDSWLTKGRKKLLSGK